MDHRHPRFAPLPSSNRTMTMWLARDWLREWMWRHTESAAKGINRNDSGHNANCLHVFGVRGSSRQHGVKPLAGISRDRSRCDEFGQRFFQAALQGGRGHHGSYRGKVLLCGAGKANIVVHGAFRLLSQCGLWHRTNCPRDATDSTRHCERPECQHELGRARRRMKSACKKAM